MGTTSRLLQKRAVTAVLAAAVVSGGLAWFVSHDSEPTPATSRSFWSYLTPAVSEIDPPDSAAEAVERSDAVVLAHVTGVRDGRPDKACAEVGLERCSIPNTVFVQLTVDRTVRGAVRPGHVLNLEMYRPPQPLTIDQARETMPTGELLFFLSTTDDVRDTQAVWGPISLTRGVIAEGPRGLFTALEPSGHSSEYLSSFGATTVEKAADTIAASAG